MQRNETSAPDDPRRRGLPGIIITKAITMDTTSIGLLVHALGLDVYLPVILGIIGVCSALAAILPHPADGSAWIIPRKLLDLVALNTGHASNAIVDSTTSKPVPPVLVALLCVGLALSACSAVPTAGQSVFAVEESYTVAAKSESATAPLLSPADLVTMQHLDSQAYAEIVRLRVPAAAGTATATDVQAAVDAVSALTTFIAKAKS